jgi:ribosomal protein L37AE/L43A
MTTTNTNWTPSAELVALPRIKQCNVCGTGTARRWPTRVLECDACGATGDPFMGLMSPRNSLMGAD